MLHSDTMLWRSGPATSDGVGAVSADHAALLAIMGEQPPDMWAAPSGCAGWAVKDVVAHLGLLFWRLVDSTRLPDTRGLPAERAQDAAVASRREWTSARVLDDYVEAAG